MAYTSPTGNGLRVNARLTVIPAKTYGADMTAISSATLSNDASVGTSDVIRENCTATDAGIDSAVSSDVSESQVARLSGDTRSRRR